MPLTDPTTDARPAGGASDEARRRAVVALESEFSELITRFRRIIIENANRVSPGMLPAAYKVFTTIARSERITVSTLSERMMADKGQISRTVRELEELGLVERFADPADRRSSLLTVTELGAERLAAARVPQEGILLRTLEQWSVDEIQNLTRLLHALVHGESPVP